MAIMANSTFGWVRLNMEQYHSWGTQCEIGVTNITQAKKLQYVRNIEVVIHCTALQIHDIREAHEGLI